MTLDKKNFCHKALSCNLSYSVAISRILCPSVYPFVCLVAGRDSSLPFPSPKTTNDVLVYIAFDEKDDQAILEKAAILKTSGFNRRSGNIFSRVHATLYAALSVRRSVGPSVHPSIAVCEEPATYGDWPCSILGGRQIR